MNTVSKTVCVTGGCGYIGSHICQTLHDNGFKVIVIDNLSTGYEKNLLNKEVFYKENISNKSALQNIFTKHQIDAVIHLAASIQVEESCRMPLKYYENNTANTIVLLEAMKEAKIKHLIFSSTAAVYGGGDNTPQCEKSTLSPINPYGKSKLTAEWIINDWCQANPEISNCVLRYFNIAGAHANKKIGQRCSKASHLIKRACQAATNKISHLTIFGSDYDTFDGTAVRDYIHVEDIASAHIHALDYLLSGGTSVTLNCGYSEGHSVKQVVSSLESILGVPINKKWGARRKGDSAVLVADARKIKNVLKWKPQFNQLETILKSALEWEKSID